MNTPRTTEEIAQDLVQNIPWMELAPKGMVCNYLVPEIKKALDTERTARLNVEKERDEALVELRKAGEALVLAKKYGAFEDGAFPKEINEILSSPLMKKVLSEKESQ